MNNELTTKNNNDILANIVLKGDVSGLNPSQKVEYYNRLCESLGLNPVTQPFQLISFQGKERLYATKDATEQLRKINKVSVTDMTNQTIEGVYIVKVKGVDKDNRSDMATGAVNIAGLKGDALCNAFMKAETKAKRRLTLSISGLGMLDESEIETIPNAEIKNITPTGQKNADNINNVFNEFDTKYQLFLDLCKEQNKLIDENDCKKLNTIISLKSVDRLSMKALDDSIEVLKRYQVANKELDIVDEKLTDVLLSVEAEK